MTIDDRRNLGPNRPCVIAPDSNLLQVWATDADVNRKFTHRSLPRPLDREVSNVRGHRDSRHEGCNRAQVDPTRSLWLNLKAENLHADCPPLRLEMLDDESGAVKQFVERDDLRAMGMTTVELEGSVLLDIDAAV